MRRKKSYTKGYKKSSYKRGGRRKTTRIKKYGVSRGGIRL